MPTVIDECARYIYKKQSNLLSVCNINIIYYIYRYNIIYNIINDKKFLIYIQFIPTIFALQHYEITKIIMNKLYIYDHISI